MDNCESYCSGICSILIYSETETPDEISRHLQILPTKSVVKGQTISKVKPETAPKNGWFYNVTYHEANELDAALQKLVRLYLENMEKFQTLENSEIFIRCCVHSNLAQIGYEVSAETMKLLSKIDKNLEFSILSWGEVEMS